MEGDINDVPQCPSCKHGWEREFLDSQLTRSYRFGTYKEHREKVLCDRQKALLPTTQEQASNYLTARRILPASVAELTELQAKIERLQRKEWRLQAYNRGLQNTITSHGRHPIPPTETAVVTATVAGNTAATENTITTAAATAKAPEPKVFIKPCPAPECRGFLSTAWKCGLCHGWSCPDCHEFKGAERDVPHTCDPGHVATAALLAREAKGCPKCGVPICKIEGCDQMWCTACNTGFSWRTGRIAEGPVHNPHYFAYLRSQGRDPTAVPARPLTCDEELDRNVLRALDIPTYRAHYGGAFRYGRIRTSGNTDRDYLTEAWRIMREEQDRGDVVRENDEKLRILRVRLMAKEITEDEWKTSLQRIEKDTLFQRAVSQVREMFVGASRDIIRGVVPERAEGAEGTEGAERADFHAIREQLERLIEYCNASYRAIQERFSRKTHPIVVKLPEPVAPLR